MTEVNAQQRPSEFIALAAFLMATIALGLISTTKSQQSV